MKPPSRHGSHRILRELSSSLADIDLFCREVRDLLTRLSLESEVFPVEMLLRESLNNAMIHGNLCDGGKKIRAEVRTGPKGIVLRVEDEGTGFDCRNAGKASPDPDKPHGRGLAIYHLYAHRVSFNPAGNRVSLWRAVTGEKKS